jgi:4-carboxymuconolactone decarboxylase
MDERTGLRDRLRPAVLDRQAGYDLLDTLQDAATQSATFPDLEARLPGFADWIVTALFGGSYQRGVLSARDRQVANLATLTALGGVDPQLAGHVRTSLRIGMTAEEVVEVIAHLAPYVGVPRTLAGLRVVSAALSGSERPAAPTGSERPAAPTGSERLAAR